MEVDSAVTFVVTVEFPSSSSLLFFLKEKKEGEKCGKDESVAVRVWTGL